MPAEEIDPYEAALRRLPETYSLALRLKQAGVADEVVCSYIDIEPEGLATLLAVAEGKLQAELHNRRPATSIDTLSEGSASDLIDHSPGTP